MSEFLKRLLSGIVFVAVLVFGIIWDRLLCGFLFLVIMYLCLKEFYGISLGGRSRWAQRTGILAAAVLFCVLGCHFYFGLPLKFLAAALLMLMLIPLSAVLYGNREDFMDVGTVYFGLLYIALPLSLIPLLTMDGEVYDGWPFLSLFILVCMNDVGAYCTGSLLLKCKPDCAKMAPEISPHKTWFGFAGGVLFCMLAALALQRLWWLPCNIWHSLVTGVIVSIGGAMGDLFESMWKRHFGVKDSGHFLPGHGGALDRFDSALVAIPLAAAYLALMGQL